MVRYASMVLSLGLILGLVGFLAAEDKKEAAKTLKGTITCAKCDLKLADKCATVIKVKEGDKDVVYYFDADSHKKNHKTICTEPKEGKVTGTVSKARATMPAIFDFIRMAYRMRLSSRSICNATLDVFLLQLHKLT